jgi:hypothetical protein
MLGSMVLPISSVRPEGTRFFRSQSEKTKNKKKEKYRFLMQVVLTKPHRAYVRTTYNTLSQANARFERYRGRPVITKISHYRG